MRHGLVLLFLFSDVPSGSGGTLLVDGSHHVAARLLRSTKPVPPGQRGMTQAVVSRTDFSVVTETTGEAGDVVLCHSLLLHAAGHNEGESVRVLAAPRVTLKHQSVMADPRPPPWEKSLTAARSRRPRRRHIDPPT